MRIRGPGLESQVVVWLVMLVILAVIDNLVKGAAGQAVQNMNLMHGLDECTGLTQLPVLP